MPVPRKAMCPGHPGEMWQAGGLHPLNLVTPPFPLGPPPRPQYGYFKSSYGTSLQIRFDVSRVQESNAHEKTRPCEGPQLPQAERPLGVGARKEGPGYWDEWQLALARPQLSPERFSSRGWPPLSSVPHSWSCYPGDPGEGLGWGKPAGLGESH